MRKQYSVRCEACKGYGWTADATSSPADWGDVCDVCRGRGSLSEYRIAKLCAGVWLGPNWVPAAWTKAALRDLRRPRRRRQLGARRSLRLLGVLSDLAAAVEANTMRAKPWPVVTS